MSTCNHPTLCYTSTSHAHKVGYTRPNLKQRLAATTPTSKIPCETNISSHSTDEKTFPAPLILPGDELSLYPGSRPQSLRSWLGSGRNHVTPERKTIYISLPPGYGEEMGFMRDWTVPKGEKSTRGKKGLELDYGLVAKYVEIFYHGLPVKVLDKGEFSWICDGDVPSKVKGKGKTKGGAKAKAKARKSTPEEEDEEPDDPRIGLRALSSDEYTVIASRPTPNYPYKAQLNLNSILDFAIESLPSDAYALLMLLEHDLYEDEEDEFVCGRAYGGSRVCVVSGARYWPGFDEEEGVERVHSWPGSHCTEYLSTMSGSRSQAIPNATMDTTGNDKTPLSMALKVHSPPTTPKALTLLHVARLARTATHEFGHCFGIGHCTYYACIMQGSSSLAEDARQPPYLCPVDEAKILYAIHAAESDEKIEEWKRERWRAMKVFCEQVVSDRGEDGRGSMFDCLGQWIGGLLGNGEEWWEDDDGNIVIKD